MLQAACYVVIAFLSGMRDGEVKHLRRGCRRVQRDADGRPYRWVVTSLAFKGERDPTGVQATWTVGRPVADAIEVLQRLHPPGVDELFAGLRHSPGQGPVSRSPNSALTSKTTNRQLNALVAWVNAYCEAHDRADWIPPVDGRPFRVTTGSSVARWPGSSPDSPAG